MFELALADSMNSGLKDHVGLNGETTMTDLSPAQAAPHIAVLLAAPENRTLDFKRISSKHGRIIEAICAFANSEGGLLVIGIGDEKGLKPDTKPESRLFGIEENHEGFD
ncbi:ATP-binding protein [Thiobacillus sp. 63-78]|uniref:AlbA family DNA-binding domain-containing protein n=1 Tax=Thiobacillus sp. 63-78 TaxID=1895859 RepID=UPI0025F1D556|nr:ATP-binding protein [Thiobacillus sp. 63-78]